MDAVQMFIFGEKLIMKNRLIIRIKFDVSNKNVFELNLCIKKK